MEEEKEQPKMDFDKIFEHELNQATRIIDGLIEKNDRYTLYKMYTLGKMLNTFLEKEIKNGNHFADNVDIMIRVMDAYYEDKKAKECSNKI